MPDTVEVQPELPHHHHRRAPPYRQAPLAPEAIGYWLKAGERAARRSAHPEAVAHLRRGLGLVEHLTEPGERDGRELDLQVALGISLLATKGFAAPEVGETYRRAE